MKKKLLIILIIGIFFTNCTDKKEKLKEKEIEYIDRWNQIELAQTDDEFGEWGGNSDIITIFSDGEKIYANYLRCLGSYELSKPPEENEVQKKWYEHKELESRIDSIELNSEQIKLIENAILELTELKIHADPYQFHSGIVNTVISRDSSLIIYDSPSKEWKSFQNLKKSITDK